MYEIFPDGKVIRKHFEKGTRKVIDREESNKASSADFRILCEKLNNCIATADREEIYTDDTDAELKIYRSFGRRETMPRGYGNSSDTVCSLICRYVFGNAGLGI